MRTVRLDVARSQGWETVVFEGIERLWVAGGAGQGENVTLTLIGERSEQPNQVESQILDIAPRHEPLVDSTVPRVDDETALPVALRD